MSIICEESSKQKMTDAVAASGKSRLMNQIKTILNSKNNNTQQT